MTAHTPGPWHRNIKPATRYGTIFAGRNTHVAHLAVAGLAPAEVEANCELIRRAPDMLAALRDLIEYAEMYAEANREPPGGGCRRAIEAAQAILQDLNATEAAYPGAAA